MKIVHVSNFDLKNDILIHYHTARKLSLGFARLGHAVFDFSDRDVARASGFLGHRKFGVRRANERLIAACRHIRPDLLVFGHADVIRAETVAEIRALFPDLRVAQWNYDPLSSADNCGRIEGKLGVVDATFITTAGERLARFARPNGLVSFLPNPVDASIETGRSFANAAHRFDFIFSARNGRTPRVWGDGPLDSDAIARILGETLPGRRLCLPGLLGQPLVYGIDYLDLFADTRIGLSLSQVSDHPLYASDRMAHMMGQGMLVALDRKLGFQDVLGDDAALFYDTPEELLDRAGWFLDHDAALRQTAERGWRAAHRLFDGTPLARYLIERTFRLPLSQDYGWPTDVY